MPIETIVRVFAFITVIAFAPILLVLVLSGPDEPDALQAEHALYCEMVQTYHATKGEFGWPPYKGECNEQNK